ncbi:hypothetical protein BFJ67_g17464 [Fusarium oxysporum f. sp. cepae]|nr:hypothetical protein BFJ67_g17464 [Fusarium oxysporum f. sp. cepae]
MSSRPFFKPHGRLEKTTPPRTPSESLGPAQSSTPSSASTQTNVPNDKPSPSRLSDERGSQYHPFDTASPISAPSTPNPSLRQSTGTAHNLPQTGTISSGSASIAIVAATTMLRFLPVRAQPASITTSNNSTD